jgi:hypothetical protein
MSLQQFSAKTFAQAAKLAERIESLEKQLGVLLQGADFGSKKQSSSKPAAKHRISPSKRPNSAAPEEGRGTLRPAVVAILRKSEKPLKTAEIYDELVAQGYSFTFKEPKKILGIRLYKMSGVNPIGGGLFKANRVLHTLVRGWKFMSEKQIHREFLADLKRVDGKIDSVAHLRSGSRAAGRYRSRGHLFAGQGGNVPRSCNRISCERTGAAAPAPDSHEAQVCATYWKACVSAATIAFSR